MPSWDAFLKEMSKLDNEEPQGIPGSKKGAKKHVLVLEIEKTPSYSRSREAVLMEGIKTFKKIS